VLLGWDVVFGLSYAALGGVFGLGCGDSLAPTGLGCGDSLAPTGLGCGDSLAPTSRTVRNRGRRRGTPSGAPKKGCGSAS